MNHSYTEIFKFSITLLSIINPIGAIPVFLGFTQNNKNLNLKNVTNTCASATSITILISLIFGNQLLIFFGISVASFTIGGGILLFMMALSMISGEQSNTKINNEEIKSFDYEREIGIIPLAIPLLSGPGAISSSIIYSKNIVTASQWLSIAIMIVLIGIIVKVVLSYAEFIGKKLGQIGLNVMTRIMGLILLSMSIEMIAAGFKDIMPILKSSL